MADISTQLSRIASAKEAMKTAINNRGGNITDNTPLSSYATAITNLPLPKNQIVDYLNGDLSTEITSAMLYDSATDTSVKNIKPYAFYSSTLVAFPFSQIENIEHHAFSEATMNSSTLKTTFVFDNLSKIGSNAFQATTFYWGTTLDIKDLKAVSNSIIIGDYAFYQGKYLTTVKIDSTDTTNLLSVGNYAFSNMTYLQTFSIEEKDLRLSLGNNVFADNAHLTTITLSDKTEYVGENCFDNCPILTYNTENGGSYLPSVSYTKYLFVKSDSKGLNISDSCKLIPVKGITSTQKMIGLPTGVSLLNNSINSSTDIYTIESEKPNYWNSNFNGDVSSKVHYGCIKKDYTFNDSENSTSNTVNGIICPPQTNPTATGKYFWGWYLNDYDYSSDTTGKYAVKFPYYSANDTTFKARFETSMKRDGLTRATALLIPTNGNWTTFEVDSGDMPARWFELSIPSGTKITMSPVYVYSTFNDYSMNGYSIIGELENPSWFGSTVDTTDLLTRQPTSGYDGLDEFKEDLMNASNLKEYGDESNTTGSDPNYRFETFGNFLPNFGLTQEQLQSNEYFYVDSSWDTQSTSSNAYRSEEYQYVYTFTNNTLTDKSIKFAVIPFDVFIGNWEVGYFPDILSKVYIKVSSETVPVPQPIDLSSATVTVSGTLKGGTTTANLFDNDTTTGVYLSTADESFDIDLTSVNQDGYNVSTMELSKFGTNGVGITVFTSSPSDPTSYTTRSVYNTSDGSSATITVNSDVAHIKVQYTSFTSGWWDGGISEIVVNGTALGTQSSGNESSGENSSGNEQSGSGSSSANTITLTDSDFSVFDNIDQVGGWNGNTTAANLIDGDATTGVYIWGNNSAGAYVIVDLTNSNSNGYNVDDVSIQYNQDRTYTVSYSMDNSTWSSATQSSYGNGSAVFSVGANAKYIKIKLTDASNWSLSLTEVSITGTAL